MVLLDASRNKREKKCSSRTKVTVEYYYNVEDVSQVRITTEVIKEMRALWLVEDCVISRYSHLAPMLYH